MMKRVLLFVFAALTPFIFFGCGSGITTVNFLNWGDYIDPDVIPMFEKEFPDIKINMTTVDSNEAMYVAAATKGSKIDVLLPSEYMIQRMMKEDMLAELNHSDMSNYKYVEQFALQNCGYDPTCKYSVPYSWGTFGIVYDAKKTDEPITDWDALFNGKYVGDMFMYDSMRDTIGIALLKLGYSINSKDIDEIEEAADLLIKQKPDVMAYGTDELRMSMINSSASVAVMFAGDAVYALEDNPDLVYVVPYGANIFVDSLCILKTASEYDAALKFVNFMLRPDIAALNAEYTGYSTPEEAAHPYIEEDLLENYAFNPPAELIENCEYYEYLEPDILSMYEDAWVRIKMS